MSGRQHSSPTPGRSKLQKSSRQSDMVQTTLDDHIQPGSPYRMPPGVTYEPAPLPPQEPNRSISPVGVGGEFLSPVVTGDPYGVYYAQASSPYFAPAHEPPLQHPEPPPQYLEPPHPQSPPRNTLRRSQHAYEAASQSDRSVRSSMGPAPRPNNNQSYRRMLAQGILQAVERGAYESFDGERYRLHRIRHDLESCRTNTFYHSPESTQLIEWKQPSKQSGKAAPGDPNRGQIQTRIKIRERSVVEAARHIAPFGNVGVLNFASAKKPGGGFLSGAQAQEESIARSSNLYDSLMTSTAGEFYELHKKDLYKTGPFYTHSLIYSGGVIMMRDDVGEWANPLKVDIVTCAAVNAGHARSLKLCNSPKELEKKIRDTMTERMARILKIFEDSGNRRLVLGSFGTGVFQNSVPMVAEIWADHLAPGGRFNNIFDEVVFAIIGKETVTEFRASFEQRFMEHATVDGSIPKEIPRSRSDIPR